LLLLGLAASVLFFTILWGVSLRLQNSSIADVGWGPSILLIGLTYYFTSDGALLRAQLTLVLLAIWAVRLGLHLFYRQRREGEDYRYTKWRDEYEDSWWWFSYFKVFLLQSVVAWVVSLPIYFAIVSVGPPSLTLLDYAGALIFVIGLVFEGLGDEQLRRFRADRVNKGKVLDTGLWSYTRHPNYFGEALVWWGFGVIGVATGGLPGLIGPAVMTYLLIYVSGVAMIEPTLAGKQGYLSYAGKTPVFLPLPAPMRAKLIQAAKKALPSSPPPPKPKRRW
jgi:steroid 5-alpha reductase family enzyme